MHDLLGLGFCIQYDFRVILAASSATAKYAPATVVQPPAAFTGRKPPARPPRRGQISYG